MKLHQGLVFHVLPIRKSKLLGTLQQNFYISQKQKISQCLHDLDSMAQSSNAETQKVQDQEDCALINCESLINRLQQNLTKLKPILNLRKSSRTLIVSI